MVEMGKLKAAHDFLNQFVVRHNTPSHNTTLSSQDLALVDSVRRPLRVELEKVKVKQRMMIRQMMGMDPDVIPAAEELANKGK